MQLLLHWFVEMKDNFGGADGFVEFSLESLKSYKTPLFLEITIDSVFLLYWHLLGFLPVDGHLESSSSNRSRADYIFTSTDSPYCTIDQSTDTYKEEQRTKELTKNGCYALAPYFYQHRCICRVGSIAFFSHKFILKALLDALKTM